MSTCSYIVVNRNGKKVNGLFRQHRIALRRKIRKWQPYSYCWGKLKPGCDPNKSSSYLVSPWSVEGIQVKEIKCKWKEIELECKKLTVLIHVPNELLQLDKK